MVKFEVKKFFYSKKNFIVLMLLGLLLITTHLFYLNSSSNVETYKPYVKESIKYAISSAEKTNQDPEKPDDAKNESENQIKIYHQQTKALESNRFNDYFDLKDELNHQYLKYGEEDKQLKEQNKEIQQDIDYYNLVNNRNLDFELMPSNQVKAFGSFMNITLSGMFTSMYSLIFAVLISVQISTHFESWEFLFYDFAKISRQRTLLQKIGAALCVTFGGVLLISAVDIISVGLMNGFGSLNYPGYLTNFKGIDGMMVGWKVDNMAIPNGQVILISLLYLFLILLFLATLGALLSVLFKKSLVVVGIIAVLVVGWSLVEQKDYMQAVRRFVPMSYLDPKELLCNPAYLFGKSSLMIGAVYLLVLSIVCYLLANSLLKNYKVRRI